jgi:predicted RNA-binding protein YlxR (DUF448 family)
MQAGADTDGGRDPDAESEAETDRGPGDAGEAGPDGPVRRCIASGERVPADRMIRFVVGPDGTVVPDLAGRLPGRGMWLSADAQSIKTAQARKAFARAARRSVTVPPDLAERIETLLARRCIEALSLARRAGEAVCGFEKTRAALKAGLPPGTAPALLLQARDGAADGCEKLAALAGAGMPRLSVLGAAEIGSAFGREAAVHGALAPGGLARRLLTEGRRLAGFRPAVDRKDGAAPDGTAAHGKDG